MIQLPLHPISPFSQFFRPTSNFVVHKKMAITKSLKYMLEFNTNQISMQIWDNDRGPAIGL